MPALLSSNSLAVHASLIHTVGFRPIQYVIKGVLYFFESSSKYIQGLLSGSWNVLPMMGYGNGPGGYKESVVLQRACRGIALTIFDLRYSIQA
jgi:hypothetical protein